MSLTDRTTTFSIPNYTVFVDNYVDSSLSDSFLSGIIINLIKNKVTLSATYNYDYTWLFEGGGRLDIKIFRPLNRVELRGNNKLTFSLLSTYKNTSLPINQPITSGPLVAEDSQSSNGGLGYNIATIRNELGNPNYLAGTIGDFQNLQSTADGSLKVFVNGITLDPATGATLVWEKINLNGNTGTIPHGSKGISLIVESGSIEIGGANFIHDISFTANANEVFGEFNFDATSGVGELIIIK